MFEASTAEEQEEHPFYNEEFFYDADSETPSETFAREQNAEFQNRIFAWNLAVAEENRRRHPEDFEAWRRVHLAAHGISEEELKNSVTAFEESPFTAFVPAPATRSRSSKHVSLQPHRKGENQFDENVQPDKASKS